MLVLPASATTSLRTVLVNCEDTLLKTRRIGRDRATYIRRERRLPTAQPFASLSRLPLKTALRTKYGETSSAPWVGGRQPTDRGPIQIMYVSVRGHAVVQVVPNVKL